MSWKQILRGSMALSAALFASSLVIAADDSTTAKTTDTPPGLTLGQSYFSVPNSFEKPRSAGLLDFSNDDSKTGDASAVEAKLSNLLRLNDSVRLTPTTHSDITAKDMSMSKEKTAFIKLQIDW